MRVSRLFYVVEHILKKFVRIFEDEISKCRLDYMLCNIFVTFCQK